MSVTLWDTNGGEVLRALHAERRGIGTVAYGLALSLVCVTDERRVAATEQAAAAAAAAHPCRILVVVRRHPDANDPRLDAEVTVGGRLGPTEAVVMRMYGRLSAHAESVVLPLLAADAPVVTWWNTTPPDRIAADPLGVLASRRVTDCALAADPVAALHARAADFAMGDTDLAWGRLTPWRSLLATTFDTPAGRPRSARVTAETGNASALLLSGWLSGRLGLPAAVESARGPGISEVEVAFDDADGGPGRVSISRPDGRTATVTRTGQPDRVLPLPRREVDELLAEELRRLDPDEVYAEALGRATGVRLDSAQRRAG